MPTSTVSSSTIERSIYWETSWGDIDSQNGAIKITVMMTSFEPGQPFRVKNKYLAIHASLLSLH